MQPHHRGPFEAVYKEGGVHPIIVDQRFLLDRRAVEAKNARAATCGTWHTEVPSVY